MTLARVANQKEIERAYPVETLIEDDKGRGWKVIGYVSSAFRGIGKNPEHYELIVETLGSKDRSALRVENVVSVIESTSLDNRKRVCVENLIESGLFTEERATDFVGTMRTEAIVHNSDIHMRLRELR